ncbi:MAG TPA: pyridoxamine 5'-phosphate oxidase family protein [Geobacteraceae bacterium]|nr:pyridoxamine 5'-phosphate oxidase family protein [Geobacteraceae bacterium]
MGEREIQEKVVEYLKSHRVMTLATVTPEGKPLAHTVKYASDGMTMFFITMKSTRKAQNILNNPLVALTVDEDYDDWLVIQGVQMEAKATILSEQEEIGRAAGIYMAKYPFVADFPPNPEIVFVKVEPTAGFFLDYSKGFTHKDAITC